MIDSLANTIACCVGCSGKLAIFPAADVDGEAHSCPSPLASVSTCGEGAEVNASCGEEAWALLTPLFFAGLSYVHETSKSVQFRHF